MPITCMCLPQGANPLDELRKEPYRRVALFTHGGVIACAQVYAGSVRLEEAFSRIPPYGGIVSILLQ